MIINSKALVTIEYYQVTQRLDQLHQKEMEMWQQPTQQISQQSRQELQQEMLQLLQLQQQLQPQQKRLQTQFLANLSTEAAREEFVRLWGLYGYDVKFVGTDLDFSVKRHL